MKSLLIDTASSKRIVSIISDNEILFYKEEDNDLNLSSCMLPMISDAFKNSCVTINDIDKIFVVSGPGSFTGIRVGVTIAKTIAWALKKDIIAISELDLMATTSNGIVIPLIDARRGYVYAGIYVDGINVFKDRHILLDEILSESTNYDDVKFVSYDSFENINSIIPKADVLKIINKHIDDKPVDAHLVNPIYLKNTEAEEKLKSND